MASSSWFGSIRMPDVNQVPSVSPARFSGPIVCSSNLTAALSTQGISRPASDPNVVDAQRRADAGSARQGAFRRTEGRL